MKRLKQHALLIGAVSALALASPLAALAAEPAASERPASFADLVEKLSPTVVNVSTTQKVKSGGAMMFGLPFQELPDTPEFEPFKQFFEQFGKRGGPKSREDAGPEREVYSLGSGFIIDAGGFIITNNHVIDDADEVSVTLSDNTKYKARIVGRDKKTDIALLKVEPKKDLPHVTLGDSDAMRVGDWVIAIGNPYGLGGSVTQGIISARQRSINAGPFDDFLQTDAPINRGNSGGPLFNLKGELIGINTAIFSPSGGSIGIGFAIPTALARPVIEQLKQFGHTQRGWLGIKIQQVSEEVADSVGLARPMGALVLEVAKDGPADKAGLKAGDIITGFDGRDISEMRFLPRMVAETRINRQVSISYWRNNASKSTQITVGELDERDEEDSAPKGGNGKQKDKKPDAETVMGMQLSPLSPKLREQLNVPEATNGVAVVDIAGSSEAARRGMRAGDVIVDINNIPVKSAEDVRKAFEAALKSGRKFALVRVAREKEMAFMTLPAADEKKEKAKGGND